MRICVDHDCMRTSEWRFLVTNNLFLGFWTARSIDGFSQGQYIGVYAALGGAQAVFSFMTSFIVRSEARFSHSSTCFVDVGI